MTKTALENKRIKSNERIEDDKLQQKKKEFKHTRAMNYLNFFKPSKLGSSISKLSHNDPSWYKSYVKDLDKFTNIATYVRNGLNTYQGYLGGVFNESANRKTESAVAGIMVFNWIPSINTATYSNDQISQEAVNQILMRTKEQVLKSNSRSSVPYEAADLGINFLATASILNAICEYERLILLAQTYEADNSYYPQAYLNALGVTNPTQWMDNLADARKNLILLKQRFNNALVAPENLTLYKKYSYLGSLWVKDSETHPYSVYSTKAQYFLKLSDAGDSLTTVIPSRSTPELFYQQISGMIQSIAENPDYVEMYADLRSAVKNLIQLDPMFNEDLRIEATYDAMALEQIANIQTLPAILSDEVRVASINANSVAIKQNDSGYLYQGLSVDAPGIQFQYDNSAENTSSVKCMNHLGSRDAILNLHTDNIDGNIIIDASRPKLSYKHLSSDVDDSTDTYLITDSDMAVFTYAQVYHNTWNYSGTNKSVTLHMYEMATELIINSTDLLVAFQDWLATYAKISNFKWAPLISQFLLTATDAWNTLTFGDTAHVVPLSKSTLRDINVACGLGLMYLDTDTFKM